MGLVKTTKADDRPMEEVKIVSARIGKDEDDM